MIGSLAPPPPPPSQPVIPPLISPSDLVHPAIIMQSLSRFFSSATNKPIRTAHLTSTEPPFLNAAGYVDFAPSDPENPMNWSVPRRASISAVSVLLVLNATMASSAPSAVTASLTAHFRVSPEVSALTVTLFLLGYCAGPLLFAPLSEFYGRRLIFVLTFAGYLAFSFLTAWPPNFAALLVGRFLTGTFASAPLSNAPGVLVDLWNPVHRATAFACFSTMVWIGPAVGPVLAGFLQLTEGGEGWRWCFWVLLWLAAGTMLLVITIPETYPPVLLMRKAQRARRNGHDVKAQIEDSDRSLAGAYRVALTRPWIILFDTISLLCAVYLAVVYMLLYMLFSIYPIVFQEMRGWNPGVGELPLLGTAVGAACGGAVVAFDAHLRQRKIASEKLKMEDLTPEDRLPLAMVGGIGFCIGMFWLAWSANYNSVHWIVPTIGGGVLSANMLLVFVAYFNYLVDVYLIYAASALAANTVVRSAGGAAAPLFTRQMFSAMGVGGGGSLVGGVGALLAVIPFLFYKYGPQIRARSKFSPTGEKAAPKGPGEEEPKQQQGGRFEDVADEETALETTSNEGSNCGRK
ncbi:Major facilitator superfamily domain, general substrate transporter [Cordyceps fumosorosea ARSEF 2679]|uniref:Major facilitator superfamily domain, general substrate transporter n=1 Tax=Cordyceps fumosorosea (strain ARSEF 2679) TaxID=1081104 RepID=A0A162IDS7_CORFA|nr:Major facilitator superfamily domain, general substrate transporter [Cordyceps fumosorosea ARSEF 2679]OAA55725.1 Major facilitator superfamily domain, general substrate transporter [Cordyceps fumosorosea ARSEF 2679]